MGCSTGLGMGAVFSLLILLFSSFHFPLCFEHDNLVSHYFSATDQAIILKLNIEVEKKKTFL